MNVLGASRFSALLAAVIISGITGVFWWALGTRSDIRASANHGMTRAMPAKFTGRVTRGRDDSFGKFDPNKADPNKSDNNRFELMGRSERSDPDQDPDRSAPPTLLANYPAGQPPSADPNANSNLNSNLGMTDPAAQNRDLEVPGYQALSEPRSSSRADMPIPVLPVPPAPPPAQPDPPAPSWQTKFPDSPFLALPGPAPADNATHQPRTGGPVVATPAARPPKAPSRSYYTEKYVDQGVYKYRRRPCEPPNMPDVCFMRQADRQPVVARP